MKKINSKEYYKMEYDDALLDELSFWRTKEDREKNKRKITKLKKILEGKYKLKSWEY